MESYALILFTLVLFTPCQVESYEIFDNNQQPNNISTHVLDVGNGHPGKGVAIQAFFLENGTFTSIGNTITQDTGRVDNVHPNVTLRAGIYKLKFSTQEYYAGLNQTTFFPSPELVFSVDNIYAHYHVPLTLSRYGYTTYKGQ